MRAKFKPGAAALLLAAALVLSGCAAQFRTHGYIPPADVLQQIVPGVDTRATVEDLVGVPTASGVQDGSGYYYIQSELRQQAWRAPEIIDRKVVEIAFDDLGVVRNITTYGLEDGQVVPLARRITRSGERNISFIRQLFGNIGGFDAGQLFGQ